MAFQLDQYAVLWFTALILSFLATSILELRWSQVSFEAWWRNEQFWLISGISAHLAAVVQVWLPFASPNLASPSLGHSLGSPYGEGC